MSTRTPEIRIRRAEPDDYKAMHAIMSCPRAAAGTLQVPFPSREIWRDRLASALQKDHQLVAEVDGLVVGMVGLHQNLERPRRRHAAGIGITVHDDWQGRGIGTALLKACLDLADNWLNLHRIELEVYADNDAAIRLYERHGFLHEGYLKDFAFRDGRHVDACVMARLRPQRKAGKAPLRVRPENTADVPTIRTLVQDAFASATHASGDEHLIVERLRMNGSLTLSLVADAAGTLVAHAAFSPVAISDGTPDWYGLGPLSVVPARQREGIGSRLLAAGLTELRRRGAAGCVVVGEPAFYARFGFRRVDGLELPGIPAEYFMALCWREPLPIGTVSYDAAFGV